MERTREDLMEELIRSGFGAVVVAVRTYLLDVSWLGRRIDHDFVKDLSRREGIDICGEEGEYHTLVLSVPFFSRRIGITKTETVTHDNHSFPDIRECELTEKGRSSGDASGKGRL